MDTRPRQYAKPAQYLPLVPSMALRDRKLLLGISCSRLAWTLHKTSITRPVQTGVPCIHTHTHIHTRARMVYDVNAIVFPPISPPFLILLYPLSLSYFYFTLPCDSDIYNNVNTLLISSVETRSISLSNEWTTFLTYSPLWSHPIDIARDSTKNGAI